MIAGDAGPLAASALTVLELQVQGLMQPVERYREQRCRELREAAAAQVREILRAARGEARTAVHEAVVQERSRRELDARRAEARAELEARQRSEQQIQGQLEELWRRIPEVLANRWREPSDRQTWIRAALEQAGLLLAGRAWTLEHADCWAPEDSTAAQALARAHGAALEIRCDATLPAGLRVRAGPVCVDATSTGLLARHEAVESAFLAECARE